MIRTALLALAAATAALTGACQSGPTPYQARTKWDGGYAETRIEDARYRITFKGNSLTERERVENYMLFRAAELTLESGYDNFIIVDRDTDKDSRIREFGGYPETRLSYVYFVPRRGWVASYDTYWTPSTYQEVTRYEASAEILLGKGPKSSSPNAFDARDVSKNLSGQIQRPAS